MRILASFETKTAIPGIPDATSTRNQPELDRITVERPVAGPPGLPAELQNILSDRARPALQDPKVVAWAKEIQDIIMQSKTPAEAAALVERQRAFLDRWKKLLVTG